MKKSALATLEYKPSEQPDAKVWLTSTEAARIAAVERFHKAAKIKLPKTQGHAAFHVIVENQIAEGYEPTVRAIGRLTSEGLDRHEAVHAISSVISEFIFNATKSPERQSPEETKAIIGAGIERITAKEWREKFK
jgi:hypothetical protein